MGVQGRCAGGLALRGRHEGGGQVIPERMPAGLCLARGGYVALPLMGVCGSVMGMAQYETNQGRLFSGTQATSRPHVVI